MENVRTTRNPVVPPVITLLLTLAPLGCRSVYRFQCTSNPTQVGVVVEEQMQGETACTVEIPRKSHLIEDGKIEFTFCLQDGREQKKVVDLHGLKPSNPFAEIVSAPFGLVGFLLAAPLLLGDEEDDEDEDSDEEHSDIKAGLVGFGFMGLGAGVYRLLGGDMHAAQGYPVYVDFNEPADVNAPTTGQDPPAPAGPGETNNRDSSSVIHRPAGSSQNTNF